MTIITKEQAQNRFATLPPTLQDTVFSVQTAEIISSIGEQYHISDDKLEDITSLVGWVLLGFLHTEDLPGEIVESTGIAPQLAKDITDSLTNKIFILIKSDIDKAFAPVPLDKIPAEPTIIQDINPSSAISTPQPPSVLIPKPITLSDVGWSKTPSAGPTIKLSPSPQAMPMPLVTSNPPPKPPQAPRATTAPAPAPAPVPTPAPKPTPKLAEPAPMMLHEDTTFKAAEKNSNFSLSKPGGSAEMSIGQNKIQAPIRPAVLEFGTSSVRVPTPPKPPTFGIQPTRYMDFKPSLSSLPTANAGIRNVSQITSTTPTPIPVPTPTPVPIQKSPAIPTPPQASLVPQPNKPIVKDFL